MTTTEENLILDMLLAKRGRITKVELRNKKKTKKEIEIEVCENAIKQRTLRRLKKNCENSFKKFTKKFFCLNKVT